MLFLHLLWWSYDFYLSICIFSMITLNSFSSRLPISAHIFGLLGFYSFPLSAACFSVFSFCLIYYGWDLFSKDCKVVAPLTYRICPQGWGWPTVLWWFPGLEVVVSAFWWVELDVVSIKGSVVSTGVLWAICELWMTLGSVVFLFW